MWHIRICFYDFFLFNPHRSRSWAILNFEYKFKFIIWKTLILAKLLNIGWFGIQSWEQSSDFLDYEAVCKTYKSIQCLLRPGFYSLPQVKVDSQSHISSMTCFRFVAAICHSSQKVASRNGGLAALSFHSKRVHTFVRKGRKWWGIQNSILGN